MATISCPSPCSEDEVCELAQEFIGWLRSTDFDPVKLPTKRPPALTRRSGTGL